VTAPLIVATESADAGRAGTIANAPPATTEAAAISLRADALLLGCFPVCISRLLA
jgi:hypothetical protein